MVNGQSVTQQRADKDRILIKHVAAIHCSNNLTLMQRKIANVLLYRAYKNLLTQDVHVITITELCKILGYNSHNYDALKDALRALISTVIEWNVLSAPNLQESWTASSVLASVQIEGTECRYTYSHHMREFLHSPSIYGCINLVIQSRFKSAYGLALYENCIRYKGLLQTAWFEINEFRKLMGVKDDEYAVFRDLNKRVIDKAVEEVNTHSDIIVEPQFRRVGRKVESIQFKIQLRNKKLRLGQIEENGEKDVQKMGEIDNLIYRLNKEFGITHMVAKDIVSRYEAEYIDKKIVETMTSDYFNNGKIDNVAAYFISALKFDYLPKKSSADIKKQANEEELKKHNEVKLLDVKNKKLYEAYIKTYYINIINKFNPKFLNSHIDEFFCNLKITNKYMYDMIKREYDEEGSSSGKFIAFFKNHLLMLKLCEAPMSYDEFLLSIKNIKTENEHLTVL